jgi:hypothetical protein
MGPAATSTSRRRFSATPASAHHTHLLKDDLAAASEHVRIPVAPTAEENVVRMPTKGVGWAMTCDVAVVAAL